MILIVVSLINKRAENKTVIETNLSFRQTEVDSQLRLPSDGDVSVEMKLLLQLQSLMVCVHYPVLLLRPCLTCEGGKKKHIVMKRLSACF